MKTKKNVKSTTNETKHELIFGRFKPNTVGGRMVSLLQDGKPRTVKEIARFAKPKSVDNITANGGWYTLLKAYGQKSGQFDIIKTDDEKLQLLLATKKARKKVA